LIECKSTDQKAFYILSFPKHAYMKQMFHIVADTILNVSRDSWMIEQTRKNFSHRKIGDKLQTINYSNGKNK